MSLKSTVEKTLKKRAKKKVATPLQPLFLESRQTTSLIRSHFWR